MAAAPCRRRGDSAKPQPGIGSVGGKAGCALGPSPLGNRPQKVRSVSRSVIENLRDFHGQEFALVPIFFCQPAFVAQAVKHPLEPVQISASIDTARPNRRKPIAYAY